MRYPYLSCGRVPALGLVFAACLVACGDRPTEGSGESGTGTGTETASTEGTTANGSAPTTSMPTTVEPTTTSEPTTGGSTDPTATTATTGPDSTGSTGSTTGVGVCGDAMVDAPEVCDDGMNDGAYGGCEPGCGALGPSCGDAVVNGPEVCDDGVNDGAYDGCAADCAAQGPFCGDAAVDDPEACDDGNQVDDDACSNACIAAVCGDGIVQMAAGEACDDGVNDGSYGGCAMDCAALGPFCGDAVLNGPEVCDDGNADNQDGCLTTCAIPKNCKEIKALDAQAADGVYTLAVGNVTWQAYCDMMTDGGGWTLAAKVVPTDAWQYSAARWIDANLVNANMPNFDHNTAKLATWNQVPFADILLGMESPVGMVNPPVPVYLKLTIAANSLLALFSPNTFVATNATKAQWLTLAPMSSLQVNCNQQGVNNQPGGMNNARVRLGILSNTQNDCMTPESSVGVGFGAFPCQNNPTIRAGNIHCEQGTEIQKPGMAWIFVR